MDRLDTEGAFDGAWWPVLGIRWLMNIILSGRRSVFLQSDIFVVQIVVKKIGMCSFGVQS